MEQTECSETLAYKFQTPENHPKESIQHSVQGKSLKSRCVCLFDSYFIMYTKRKDQCNKITLPSTQLFISLKHILCFRTTWSLLPVFNYFTYIIFKVLVSQNANTKMKQIRGITIVHMLWCYCTQTCLLMTLSC